MRLLREEERKGRLRGLSYGGDKTLMHQIYADGTGINLMMEEAQFDRLTLVLQQYEEMSGAKLNMSKSLIMSLKPNRTPSWVHNTGCEFADAGDNFIYLGVSTSILVNEQKIIKSIILKIRKKLSYWSNRLLSWPARTLLLRHVFAVTPLYQLLAVRIDGKGIEAVERLLKEARACVEMDGNWKPRIRASGLFLEEQDRGKLQHLEDWISNKTLVNRNLHEIPGWKWKEDGANFQWDNPTKFWGQ
ncbi:hypothetical protein R1sor_005037 [Riccia sorocarpa]|uniref:Reverse transcriptase domain-containing protein n=1 Tax=Riccia sorocarpa TaxID=122646 RepID=A0ABD3HKM0_9MARC